MSDEVGTDESYKPVVVTVSASSAQGTGSGTIETPIGQRDIILKVINPLTVIAVRAGRTFLQTLMGTLVVGAAAPATLGAVDFYHALMTGASLSVAAGVICIIQNLIELLAKFDQTHPTLTS